MIKTISDFTLFLNLMMYCIIGDLSTKKRYAKFEQRVMGTDKRGYSERSLYLMIPVDKLNPLNIDDTDS